MQRFVAAFSRFREGRGQSVAGHCRSFEPTFTPTAQNPCLAVISFAICSQQCSDRSFRASGATCFDRANQHFLYQQMRRLSKRRRSAHSRCQSATSASPSVRRFSIMPAGVLSPQSVQTDPGSITDEAKAFAAMLLAHRIVESDDGELGGVVDRPALDAVPPADAGNGGDHCAGAPLQQRQRRVRAVEYADDVGIDLESSSRRDRNRRTAPRCRPPHC